MDEHRSSIELRLPSRLGFEKVAMNTAASVAHLMGFSGERIEDHVDAAPSGRLHHGVCEISVARIDHMLYSERLEQRAFDRAAGRGDDLCPEMVRNLNGGHANAPRARVNQDTLSLAHPGDIVQGVPGGHAVLGTFDCEALFAQTDVRQAVEADEPPAG